MKKRHLAQLLVILGYLFLYSLAFSATGVIEIYSNPSGAKVYIDGTYVGKTPYQNVEISIGAHKIKVELNKDYPAQFWEVNIDAITPQTKTFNFKGSTGGAFTGNEMEQIAEKYKGSAQFASVPTGATVYINDEQKKKTPIGYADVSVGNYNVEFKLNGKTIRGVFEILTDNTVKVIADFNKMKIATTYAKAVLKKSCWTGNTNFSGSRREDVRTWPHTKIFIYFDDYNMLEYCSQGTRGTELVWMCNKNFEYTVKSDGTFESVADRNKIMYYFTGKIDMSNRMFLEIYRLILNEAYPSELNQVDVSECDKIRSTIEKTPAAAPRK